MIEMTLCLAEKIATAALNKAQELNRPIGVSVVDEAGRMVYYARSDNAGFYTFDTSKAKAMVAASYKRPTIEIDAAKEQNPLFWYSLGSVIPSHALPSPGGRPIIKEGRCIGAIGVGGGTPEEDDACCLAGNDAIL